MVNTMADLKRVVARRLRKTLHGREIDMMKGVAPRLQHMLGVTPLDEVNAPSDEDGTLLDQNHEFWDSYQKEIRTKRDVMAELEDAVRLLKQDGVFELSYPHGREADIIYCEVNDMDANTMETTCSNCGELLSTEPSLSQKGRTYYITVSIDCPSCDFSDMFERKLLPA